MYPRKELTALAVSKADLLDRICVRRERCCAAAARVARPLETLDRGIARWRQLSPFVKIAAVPLGFLLKRRPSRSARVLGALMRWGPLVLGAVRGMAEVRSLPRRG
jgi:hypothetical protein